MDDMQSKDRALHYSASRGKNRHVRPRSMFLLRLPRKLGGQSCGAVLVVPHSLCFCKATPGKLTHKRTYIFYALEINACVTDAKAKIHYISFPVASPQHERQVCIRLKQKSVVSVVSCRFPNSITTCCRLVSAPTSPQ